MEETGGIVMDGNRPQLGFSAWPELTAFERRVAKACCTVAFLTDAADDPPGSGPTAVVPRLWDRSRARLDWIQQGLAAGRIRACFVRGFFLDDGCLITQDHSQPRGMPLRACWLLHRNVPPTRAALLQETEGDAWAWVPRLERSRDRDVPVVCVPYDGGTAYTPATHDVFAAPVLPARVLAVPAVGVPFARPERHASPVRIVSHYRRNLQDARRGLQRLALTRGRCVSGPVSPAGVSDAADHLVDQVWVPHIEEEDLPDGTGATHGRILWDDDNHESDATDESPLWLHVTHFASPGSSGGLMVQADRAIVGFQYGRRMDANYNIVLDAIGAMAIPRETLITTPD